MISALIPANNEAENLVRCLSSIKEQTTSVDEIIVVADNCTDDTAQVAESFGALVVLASQGAKAGSQNEGLLYVSGEYLICVDADTVLAPDVVELFMAELSKPSVDATCANMLPMPEQQGFWVANRRFAYALGRYWWRWCQSQLGRLMVLSGCAYALRTDTVRKLGGFPGDLITCDMDLTWCLYEAGYHTSFCHRALAYTFDPETFDVYRNQMRRWASGFYQNFARHRRQLTKPSAALVVGSLLYDLLMLPIGYTFVVWYAWSNPGSLKWITWWLIVHAVVTSFVASRTVGWKQALKGYPAYWIVNWFNKGLYLWTFFREWVLGKHYASWTGRQGRATVITPMSDRRKTIFTLGINNLMNHMRRERGRYRLKPRHRKDQQTAVEAVGSP